MFTSRAGVDIERLGAFVDLVGMASSSDRQVIFDKTRVTLTQGQLVASRRFLARRWGFSTGKVDRFLSQLVDANLIEIGHVNTSHSTNRKANRGTNRVTVCHKTAYMQPRTAKRTAKRTKVHIDIHNPPEKTASSPPPGRHKAFIEWWSAQYRERFGYDYKFAGGADGVAVKRLLEIFPTGDGRRLRDAVLAGWTSKTDYVRRQSGSLKGFAAVIHQIIGPGGTSNARKEIEEIVGGDQLKFG